MNPAASIYRYNIKISNLEDKYKRKRPRIIELLLEAPFFRAAVSANIGIATDLSGLMVTSKALVFNPEKENDTSRVFDVLYKVSPKARFMLHLESRRHDQQEEFHA